MKCLNFWLKEKYCSYIFTSVIQLENMNINTQNSKVGDEKQSNYKYMQRGEHKEQMIISSVHLQIPKLVSRQQKYVQDEIHFTVKY